MLRIRIEDYKRDALQPNMKRQHKCEHQLNKKHFTQGKTFPRAVKEENSRLFSFFIDLEAVLPQQNIFSDDNFHILFSCLPSTMKNTCLVLIYGPNAIKASQVYDMLFAEDDPNNIVSCCTFYLLRQFWFSC